MDRRFVWGVGLIIGSLLYGVLFKFYLLARFLGTPFSWTEVHSYLSEPLTAWSAVLYAISWPILFLGIYLCGPQGVKYAHKFTKYITYKYYHKQAKKHVPRLAKKGVRGTRKLFKKTHRMVDKAGDRAEEMVEHGKKRTKRALKRHGLLPKKPQQPPPE